MESEMTPLEIEVLIHCHSCPAPHPRLNAPTVAGTITEFKNQEVIRRVKNYWETTDKGKAMIRLLCSIPLPTQQWIDQYGNVIT